MNIYIISYVFYDIYYIIACSIATIDALVAGTRVMLAGWPGHCRHWQEVG